MPYERLRPSFVFDEERLKQLKQVVPEAFADGKINWESLRGALGQNLEEEGAEAEHFGLFWPGKREARKLASVPSKGALIPVKSEGVNEDSTKNIFIEGENFEVLKLLQKSYAGKIKMIYIDPPYNTGNDFIYDDNFTEPLEEYLKCTGQIDEEGRALTTNTKSDGRFHSKWLSMMYPRLRLARNLLKEDGVIFISIDDNEAADLKKLCDEIFGEENFIDCIIWKKRYGGGAKEKYLVSLHEYSLFYAKNKDSLGELFIPLNEDSIDRYYKNKDANYHLRGPYRTHPLEAGKAVDNRANLIFPIIAPDGTKILPERQWYWSEERVKESIKKGEIEFVKGKNGWTVHSKQYLKDENGEIRLAKAFSIIDDVYSQHGTNEMIDIFGNAKVFPYPKPSNLIMQLINIATNKEELLYILDFFAGSGTTAHAVLSLNKQDGGNRRFVLVQLPEPCAKDSEAFKAGYKNIADIGKERIRRVIKRMLKGKRRTDISSQGVGFKVFKLQKSNFNEWQQYEGVDIKQLERLFDKHSSPLVDGWEPEQLLAEVMLQEGFPLDSEISKINECKKNTVNCVRSEYCEHKLYICFDERIYKETIDQLQIGGEDRFICLDGALTDEQKVRLSDKGYLKTV